MANNMSTRKALEIELLYSEEPKAFEKGYADFWDYKDNSKSYSGMAKLAYNAGLEAGQNELDYFDK